MRRALLGAAAIGLFAFPLAFASLREGLAQPRLPNIVIIFTDDQGYADVGVFGAKGFTTPNLDRMAKGGRRFTNFHVAQPVCSASRAALLTGAYPNRIGIQGALDPSARHGINSSEMTLAELVKQRGYATAIFGKWHLGHRPEFLPTRHGFDEYFGLPYSNDMLPEHSPPKPGDYPLLPLIEGEKTVQLMPDQAQLTTRYTEHAVKFIAKNKDRPFLLYVAHNMPHVPLHVSDTFKGRSQRGLYGDVIMEIDWSVGEILAALKDNRLDEQTLVIFTSDNGPWLAWGDEAGSAYPLREGKKTAWEGGTRVPCIMRWPDRIPAGSVSGEPMMTIDLFPTVARLIGAQLPKHKIDGLDVWPIIAGDTKAKNPHEAYYFYYEPNELQAVLSGRWKLILPHAYTSITRQPGRDPTYQARKTGTELYDLENDVSETTDVAAKHPDVMRRLEALAEKARQDLGDSLTNRVGNGIREPGRASEVP